MQTRMQEYEHKMNKHNSSKAFPAPFRSTVKSNEVMNDSSLSQPSNFRYVYQL